MLVNIEGVACPADANGNRFTTASLRAEFVGGEGKEA